MMGWSQLRGHDRVRERFRIAIARDRLASTFLFVGLDGIGKRSFAHLLAQSLFCEQCCDAEVDACGTCPSCQQVNAGTHPDLLTLPERTDGTTIPLKWLIGPEEHRMREGLCYELSTKPTRGKRKIAIIEDSDYLSVYGANCLLKTLEEPPAGSLIILIGSSAQKQLPTIRSRCQIVPFQPLCADDVADVLLAGGDTTDAQAARQAARFGAGSIAIAKLWFDDELQELRRVALKRIASPHWNVPEIAGEIFPHIEAAGKEATLKRVRMRFVCDVVATFMRMRLRHLEGVDDEVDETLEQALSSAGAWQSPAVMAGLERTMFAREQVDRNAHLATWLDAWLSDLDRIQRGEPLPAGLLAAEPTS